MATFYVDLPIYASTLTGHLIGYHIGALCMQLLKVHPLYSLCQWKRATIDLILFKWWPIFMVVHWEVCIRSSNYIVY